MEHMKFETPDMVTENIDKIAALCLSDHGAAG